jgi:hypothetical protein
VNENLPGARDSNIIGEKCKHTLKDSSPFSRNPVEKEREV